MLKTMEELKNFLLKNGYSLKDEDIEKDLTHYATLKGKGVVIGIGIGSNVWYKTLDNRVAFESKETFNKWSQVPFSLKIPVDSERLLKLLVYASTKGAIEKSNNFEVIDWDGLN